MEPNLNEPHSMGTTIIGVTYNGGVVLGADSRTSTGMYVANRASDKITQLTDIVQQILRLSLTMFVISSISALVFPSIEALAIGMLTCLGWKETAKGSDFRKLFVEATMELARLSVKNQELQAAFDLFPLSMP